jgi:uncharacterized protein (TIGR02677 family)
VNSPRAPESDAEPQAPGATVAQASVATAPGESQAAATPAPNRDLFRYVVAQEWVDYRAIVGIFADTFFCEFTPADVAVRLEAAGHVLEADTVGERLESLRRWGNLTVSSAVGNPQSIQDYYRRRQRYLITRAGQEVHQVVEGVLTRVDAVADVSTARLRALLDALDRLAALDANRADPSVLADAVGAVFDPHEAFTAEITQLFAAINQWQSRYDLTSDELRFFAEVLVGYVGERLDEIERAARPIGHRLASLQAQFGTFVERANKGLAGRVDAAGLSGSIAVRHRAGSRLQDWQNLCSWFLRLPGRASRIETLTRESVAAVRTLTLNLTRLSRTGVGSASRRADFLRLAQFFDRAPEQAPRLAAAAFGLAPTNHYGTVSADAGDPAPTTMSWWDAPRAEVALSLRERGDSTPRGRTSPIPDRSRERAVVEQRRAQERAALERVDHELLDEPVLDGRSVSAAALARIQQLVGRTLVQLGTRARLALHTDGRLVCRIERTPGRNTCIHSPDGTLAILDLTISCHAAGAVETSPANEVGSADELASAV